MKKRCDSCGGRFGLVRHRHFWQQFCTKVCKQNRLQKLASEKERKAQLLQWPTGTAGRRHPVPPDVARLV